MRAEADTGRSPADDQIRQLARQLLPRATAGIVGGWLIGAATLALDAATGLRLPLAVTNVQVLLGALAGAILTIGVFTLWMRTVVVGLAAGQVSPRVVASYLDDDFQHRVAGWVVAGFAYVVVVLALLPEGRSDADPTGVPAISTVLSVLIVVAALMTVLLAIRHAVTSLSLSNLVRVLTDQALEVMRHPAGPDDHPPMQSAPGGISSRIVGRSMGWVQHVDHDALIAAVPAHTTITVHAAVGEFVTAGEVVATVDAELDDDTKEQLSDAISLASMRRPDIDLAFAIQQLVDVAQHAMTPSSNDTSTAVEALVHLRAVLSALIRNGKYTGCLNGDDGRFVVTVNVWDPADHVEAAFERLRRSAAQMPVIVERMIQTIDQLERVADEVDDHASADILRHQRAELVASAEAEHIPLHRRSA
jgi:uncharacterized membrane protein